MTHQALSYMLQSREARAPRDPFVVNLLLYGLAFWLFLQVFGLRHWPDFSYVKGTGQFVLSLISLFLVISLPMRQLQKDAAVHASLYGGRCYDEVLGSLLRPREIVDQIAFHSVTRCLRSNARWVALIAGLWLLLMPGWFLHLVLAAVAWFPVTAIFVLATSYLAQQLTIYRAQLNKGLAGSFLDSLLALVTSAPMVLSLLFAFFAVLCQYLTLAFAFSLAYVILGVVVSRALAIGGIERLPGASQTVQRLNRRWLGSRRNPWVFTWSQNPIVVRERARDAGRIPGHLLGALIFQAPLASTGLFLTGLFHYNDALALSDVGTFYGCLGLVGCLQLLLASHRASGAIVGEVVSQTMEPMQNTRLHAREFLFGWLQVAAVPRVAENLVILIALYFLFGTSASPLTAIPYALAFLLTPIVGAALGLWASYAPSREKAAKAHSNLLTGTLFGWYVVYCFASLFLSARTNVLESEYAGVVWCGILLLYGIFVVGFARTQILHKIEIR